MCYAPVLIGKRQLCYGLIFWAWTDNICHMACILIFDSLNRYGMQLFCAILGVGEKECCLVLQKASRNELVCAPASVTIQVNCLGGERTRALFQTRQNSSNLFAHFIRKISRVILSCSAAKPCCKLKEHKHETCAAVGLSVALDRKHLSLICLCFGGRCG